MVPFPTASAGVQFRKAQQVYQNLCWPFVALSFQKPELVPDLILLGGGLLGSVLPQHLEDFRCFWMSVINIVLSLGGVHWLLLAVMKCIVCVRSLD